MWWQSLAIENEHRAKPNKKINKQNKIKCGDRNNAARVSHAVALRMDHFKWFSLFPACGSHCDLEYVQAAAAPQSPLSVGIHF